MAYVLPSRSSKAQVKPNFSHNNRICFFSVRRWCWTSSSRAPPTARAVAVSPRELCASSQPQSAACSADTAGPPTRPSTERSPSESSFLRNRRLSATSPGPAALSLKPHRTLSIYTGWPRNVSHYQMSYSNCTKANQRNYFFIILQLQSSDIILSLCIKHSISDIICDVNY